MVSKEKDGDVDSEEYDVCQFNFKCYDETEQNIYHIICPKAPCPLNLFKFGQHERILDFYLDADDWDNAYFYYQDLLPLFNIDCSIEQLDQIKAAKTNVETKDLPIGCRIFKFSDELREFRNTLKSYKKTKKEDISIAGSEIYKSTQVNFRKTLGKSLELLKHASIDKRNKKEDEDRGFEMGLKFLDKTIEAAKKYGIDVKDTPNIVEEGFRNAAKMAGFDKNKEKQDRNIQKLKEAKMKALNERITQEMKETGDISEETKKRMQELGEKTEN